MTVETMTAEDIRREGMRALKERLGVVGAVRFLQQFNEPGHDYTADRASWADVLAQDEIVSAIETLGQAPSDEDTSVR